MIHFKSIILCEGNKINSSDIYIEIQGDQTEVIQFIDAILSGKLQTEISTKRLLKTPVKLTKKNLRKY